MPTPQSLPEIVNRVVGDALWLRDLPEHQRAARKIVDDLVAFSIDRVRDAFETKALRYWISAERLSGAEQRALAAGLNKSRALGIALAVREGDAILALRDSFRSISESVMTATMQRTATAFNAGTPEGVTATAEVSEGERAQARAVIVGGETTFRLARRRLFGFSRAVRARLTDAITRDPSPTVARAHAEQAVRALGNGLSAQVDRDVRLVVSAADVLAQSIINGAPIRAV